MECVQPHLEARDRTDTIHPPGAPLQLGALGVLAVTFHDQSKESVLQNVSLPITVHPKFNFLRSFKGIGPLCNMLSSLSC